MVPRKSDYSYGEFDPMKGRDMNGLRYLNGILTTLAILMALQLWTTWTATAPGLATEAHAQGIPDSGAQRAQMINQLKLVSQKVDTSNKLLTSTQQFLKSGKLQVNVHSLTRAK